MKKILENPILNLIARIVVGWVFIYAAVGKIADPADFANDIENYQLLPDFMINIIALTLPWIELVCGVFLITGIRIRANALLATMIFAVFNIAVFFAMAKGLNIDCGCFSDRASMVGWGKIGENMITLILSLYIFFFPVNKLTLERFAITEHR